MHSSFLQTDGARSYNGRQLKTGALIAYFSHMEAQQSPRRLSHTALMNGLTFSWVLQHHCLAVLTAGHVGQVAIGQIAHYKVKESQYTAVTLTANSKGSSN